MNSVTASPSRPQLDRQAKVKAPQSRPSLRSGKLTAKKKKPSETLTERFRELAVKYSVPFGYLLIMVCSTMLIMVLYKTANLLLELHLTY